LGAIRAEQDEAMGEILIVLTVDDIAKVHVDLDDEYEGSNWSWARDTGAAEEEGPAGA